MNSDLGYWQGQRRDSLPSRNSGSIPKFHSTSFVGQLAVRPRSDYVAKCSRRTIHHRNNPLNRASTFDESHVSSRINGEELSYQQPRSCKQASRPKKRSVQKQRRNSDCLVPVDLGSGYQSGLDYGFRYGYNRPWPPRRHNLQSSLRQEEAEEAICTGASRFKGDYDPVPHMAPGSYRFFAVMKSEYCGRTDRASWHNDAFKRVSYSLTGPSDSPFPWMSLEQPSMESCFGRRPGTTTLNFVVGKSGCTKSPIAYGTDVRPKKIKLMAILERLRQLETGLEENNPDRLYQSLYGNLIYEIPDDARPHYAMESQISDLLTVLSHPDWTDFRLTENHVVAEYFDNPDTDKKHHFLHQLLLSVELYLRIHSRSHHHNAKRKLLQQLPPKISWDLALAERWLDNMSISKSSSSSTKSTFSFDLRSKERQKDALLDFARILKWPNLGTVTRVLAEKSKRQVPVEDLSSATMSWFTGVLLPGPSLPWLVMNSLIACDGETGNALDSLSHIRSAAGFQYRANTYWSYDCIVGKVLGGAKGVNQVAGWIGPCHFSPDLKRSESVHIKQLKTEKRRSLSLETVRTMDQRTDPLGQKRDAYLAADFDVPLPDTDHVVDNIRLEKLSFRPAHDDGPESGDVSQLSTFRASTIFALNGKSSPLELLYDVDFITAYPCHRGQHALYREYAYRAIKVGDGLLKLCDWALRSRKHEKFRRDSYASDYSDRTVNTSSTDSNMRSSCSQSSLKRAAVSENCRMKDQESHETVLDHSQALITRPSVSSSLHSPETQPTTQPEPLVGEVLVIESLGVSDNEVFARAWCARWGCSAIVANLKDTCLACAIREAYAVDFAVVIATEGGKKEEEDETL